MSKRAAQWQGGEERYGGFGEQTQQDEMSDRPVQATAAQLAKRKIASLKRRPRSESPFSNTGSIYEQANQNGLLGNAATQAPSNPFAAANNNSSFTFGSNTANGTTTPSFGSGGGSFNFGANNAQPATGFTFGSGDATTPSTSMLFGQQSQTTQPQPTNGTTPSTSFTFGQQNGTTPGSTFNFGQVDATPKPATNAFGNSFSTTQDTPKAQNNFGATQGTTKPTDMFSAQNSQPVNIFGNNASTNGTSAGFTFAPVSQPNSTDTSKPTANLFSGFGQQTEKEPPSSGAATNGWAAFTQQKPSEPLTNGSATSAAPSFGGFSTAPTSMKSVFSDVNAETSKVPTFKFTPLPNNSADDDMSMLSPDNTPQKPAAVPSVNGSTTQNTQDIPKPTFTPLSRPSLFERISKPGTENAEQTPARDTSNPKPFQPSTSLFSPKPTTSASISTNVPSVDHAVADAAPKDSNAFDGFRELNESLLQHLQGQTASLDWSPIFQYYISEAKKLQSNQSSSGTTASQIETAPTPAKATFSFGSNTLSKSTQPPTTDAVAYPKLPDSASNTAKLFQATLEKSSSTPSTTSLFVPKPATETPNGGFQPTGGSSAGSSFLSSFGQKAKETAEKEKKKRKDADFDSDEDNEEEWEKRDREEQEAKKASVEAAAPAASGFTFKPTPAASTSSSSIFTGFGQPAKTNDAPTKPAFNFGNSSTTSASTPKVGLFNTPSTPAANSSNIFANAAKSATPLFSFGQASTPAPAQSKEDDQEGEEGDAAPPEPQLADMAVLLPSEEKENDVLYHVEKSKSRKLESRPAEGGAENLTWTDKGLGPLWILRDKKSGKSRVLQKIKDSGRAAMNFSVLAGAGLYKHEGMNGKAVTSTFVDHLSSNSTGKPSRWLIIVGKQDDAKEIARILQEEQKNA